MQMSFSSGEINPILHARVDLTRYHTGLAELSNMIVLPQGGVTRRGGFSQIKQIPSGDVRYIPFEYSSTDNILIELREKTAIFYSNVSENLTMNASISTPYEGCDIADIRYVQSGNVMFLTHRKYKPMMLRRESLSSWVIEELPYRGGPFIDGAEWNSNAVIRLEGSGDYRTVQSTGAGIFTSGLEGTLLKLEYAVSPSTETFTSEPAPLTGSSSTIEVKGTLNVMTTGEWKGIISVLRSSDGGDSWVTIRQYKRTDPETQGQWDFSVSETEAYILYRVTAQHTTDTNPIDPDTPVYSAGDDTPSKEPAEVTVSASGFLKSEIYRITSISSEYSASVKRETKTGYAINDSFSGRVSLWSIGAWGNDQGYPGACAMYQDRLIFAGTSRQPQTIWMSRTGDYADFSISDPLKDDDAVTLTLAAKGADGIHSLVTGSDLLAFTLSGEWKIRGSGDSGAITPSALTAHQQTSIGTKDIQPVEAGGRIIVVQAQGQKVYALGYDLNTDGYTGSEISILSSHILERKQIISMEYQKNPDSVLWFVLDDGTLAGCTFNPEHEIIGWSRHNSAYEIKGLTAVTGDNQTEIFAVMSLNEAKYLHRLNDRRAALLFADGEYDFDSELRTLRLNAGSENASGYTERKLVARVILSVIDSVRAWVAPGELNDSAKNWQRRRKVTFQTADYITDADIQMDNGFSEYACVHVKNVASERLTIAAITPIMTAGG